MDFMIFYIYSLLQSLSNQFTFTKTSSGPLGLGEAAMA